MNTKVIIALGTSAGILAAGLAGAATGTVPTQIAAAMVTLGASAGAVVGVLVLVEGFMRLRNAPSGVEIPSRVQSLIGISSELADAAHRRGFLVLLEASAGPAWGLMKHGCERVVRADDPAAIRADLAHRAEECFDRCSKTRARLGLLCVVGGVLALMGLFVVLVRATDYALSPSGFDLAAGSAILACAYGAFVLFVTAQTLIEGLSQAEQRDAMTAVVAIEAVLAIRAGLNGAATRTLLERTASRGLDTIVPGESGLAVAA